MSTITQQIYEHAGSLPYEMQEETLDFIRFLKTKLELNNKQLQENLRTFNEKSDKPTITHKELSANLQKTAPLTQSLVGTLQGTQLDEQDYKKHVEDKYLWRFYLIPI